MTLLGLAVVLVCVLILVALYRKGDVKAALKVAFLSFSLEAKDKREKKR